jgi:hypothetical protein
VRKSVFVYEYAGTPQSPFKELPPVAGEGIGSCNTLRRGGFVAHTLNNTKPRINGSTTPADHPATSSRSRPGSAVRTIVYSAKE